MKKGEISSSVVVGMILLLAGAVLILIIYATIDWTGETNRGVCEASVVMRGAVPSFGDAKSMIPLSCKTQKICITASAGLLAKITGKEGKCEDYYKDLSDVVLVKVDTLEEVERYISQQMVECWQMMGEGKLSLYSNYLGDIINIGVEPDCFICNQIAFDKSLEKGVSLEYLDILDYMVGHKYPGMEKSYFEYLGGKVTAGENKDVEDIDELIKRRTGREKAILENQEARESREPLVILFSQIFSKEGIAGDLGEESDWWIRPLDGIRSLDGTYYNRYLVSGYCGAVTSGKGAEQGCSMIQILPYKAEELAKKCGYFEGVS
jgi:hypothetical protein